MTVSALSGKTNSMFDSMQFNLIKKNTLILFRINSTHTFMAGGYAGIYNLCDTTKNIEFLQNVIPGDNNTRPSKCDDDTVSADSSELKGALILDRAWMYIDGAWHELSSMSTKRDRPHCSLVEGEDGLVGMIKSIF